ncbi:DUF6807 family protein [uncultured Draconibacterium sp.]|uniref:DUF6807 family protein n=1 Tax=uncultured Draconibacterium sp. TaxID=1573823 RepID=UPI0025E302E1|nr:DUF6807 family protein [uncultured Draconibacterium sp.]
MKYFLMLVLFIVVAVGVSSGQLTMKKETDGIRIVDGNSDVLFYQVQPKSKNGKFERCNYVHPLWGIDGQVLTEDFPADHLHHRGVFWSWHQVWIDDKRIGDPWELSDFEQDISEVEFIKEADQTVWIRSEVLWLSDKWKINGRKAPYLKEKVGIHVHKRVGQYRKIDFEIQLLALEENLRLGGSEDEKGYGGFSVRLALPDDVGFIGKKGTIEPQNTAVSSPGFVQVKGSMGQNNSTAGIIIVDEATNPDFPQQWILRAKNSMQNVAWPGANPVSLSTTEPLVLNYSLIVHAGKMKTKKIIKIIEP